MVWDPEYYPESIRGEEEWDLKYSDDSILVTPYYAAADLFGKVIGSIISELKIIKRKLSFMYISKMKPLSYLKIS